MFITVVAGPSGSGKSTISLWIRRQYRMRYVNIGDLLRAKIPYPIDNKRNIGDEFFRNFSMEDYISLVCGQVEASTILDGLRVPELLPSLHQSCARINLELITIYCDGDARGPEDPYAVNNRIIRASADFRLPWSSTADKKLDLLERYLDDRYERKSDRSLRAGRR